MVLELLYRLVRGRGRPFVKEAVYDEASADVSRSIAGTFNTDELLHRPCYQLDVPLVAIWEVNIFHHDITDWIVEVGGSEGLENARDTYNSLRVGVEDLSDCVLGQGLVHGRVGAKLDPGRDWPRFLIGEGDSTAVAGVPGASAKGDDFITGGYIGGTVVSENDIFGRRHNGWQRVSVTRKLQRKKRLNKCVILCRRRMGLIEGKGRCGLLMSRVGTSRDRVRGGTPEQSEKGDSRLFPGLLSQSGFLHALNALKAMVAPTHGHLTPISLN